jgi:hypothetical protein
VPARPLNVGPLCDMSTSNIGILSELPPELAYLAEPAMRYGVHQFDSQMDDFLRSASKAEMADLSRLAKKVLSNYHYPLVLAWLKTHEMTEYEEAANLYFLFGLMECGRPAIRCRITRQCNEPGRRYSCWTRKRV